MRKDWVVRIGCICLFAAGAIWGAIPRGTGFFKIDNIHDFVETLAGIATVLGVLLAITEYSSWKARTLAQSDHELSKKVLAVIRAYKPQAVDIYSMSEILSSRMYSQIGYRDQLAEYIETVKSNLKMFQDSHAEIYALAMECRDSWEGEVWDAFEEIFSLTNQCKMVVELYLRWSDEKNCDDVRNNIADKAIAMFDVITIFIGDKKEAVEAHLAERFEILTAEVKSKRLTV